MKAHVKDFLAGGGEHINPHFGTLRYYGGENKANRHLGIRDVYNPQRVCALEEKIYAYLKAEEVPVLVSHVVPCESFLSSETGFVAVVMPYHAEYREDQLDRLCGLAHEVGHYLDFKFNYDFHYDLFSHDFDQERILVNEVNAWQCAYDILNAIGFREWDYFLRRMKEALMSYFRPNRAVEVMEHISGIRKLLRNQAG